MAGPQPVQELAGLKHLIKAPSRAVIEEILSVPFKKRQGLSEKDHAAIVEALNITPEEEQELVASVRLLIRIAMRKDLTELAGDFPETIDPRLRNLLARLMQGLVPQWKEALAKERAAAQQETTPQQTQTPPEPQQQPAPKAAPGPETPRQQQKAAPVPVVPSPEPQKKSVTPQMPAQQKQQPPSPQEHATAPAPQQQQKKTPPAPLPRPQATSLQPSLPKLLEFDWRIDILSSSDSLQKMRVPSVLLKMSVQQQPKVVGEQPEPRVVTFELSREALNTMLEGLQFVRTQLAAIK